MSDEKLKVLCVEDEAAIRRALERILSEDYEVLQAANGALGVEALAQHKDVAIVISDMRMPEMDGAAFLAHARRMAPNAVRLLLTGYSDMSSAMAAVNEGQIFRLLTKPCAPDDLRATLRDAAEQHRLITAEKVLLQQTLLGCIKALVDVVSLASPTAFGRAARLKRKVSKLARRLDIEHRWAIEAAAMLSQLAVLPLPQTLIQRIGDGEVLEADEQDWVDEAHGAVSKMLSRIPRLERVVEILNGAATDTAGLLQMPLGAQLLHAAMALDAAEARGEAPATTLAALGANTLYREDVLQALKQTLAEQTAEGHIVDVQIAQLKLGMVLAQDLIDRRGVILAPRGCEVTPSFLTHVRQFHGQFEGSSTRVVV